MSHSGLENLRLTTVGDPPRWPRHTLLSAEVDTKFRRQVAIVRLRTKGHGVKLMIHTSFKTVLINPIVYDWIEKY
jgi:hypothetical protein